MSRRPAPILRLALLIVVGTVAAACGTPPGSSVASDSAVRTVAAAEAVALLADRVVIDVRSAAEFDAGHLAGAWNIDVQGGDFGIRIAALDRDASYLVYCRSGRRSAAAASAMAAAGFSDVVDGGGMDGLVAAGAATE